jgi:adenylylsulfate kinase
MSAGSSLVSNPVTFWLTGLSGSGKTTIANALGQEFEKAAAACVILDGDMIRSGLCNDLGFSAADRSENIRRIAEVAALFNRAGLHAVVAFISPYSSDRARARAIIGPGFMEIHIATPLSVCEARDTKGLYKKARAGLIAEFTGVSAPYEEPGSPELRIDTATVEVFDAVSQIMLLTER